jgi:hypothetical protein
VGIVALTVIAATAVGGSAYLALVALGAADDVADTANDLVFADGRDEELLRALADEGSWQVAPPDAVVLRSGRECRYSAPVFLKREYARPADSTAYMEFFSSELPQRGWDPDAIGPNWRSFAKAFGDWSGKYT